MIKSFILATAMASMLVAGVANAQPRQAVVVPQPNPFVEVLPYILVGALVGGIAGAAIGGSVAGGSALAVGTHSGLWFGATAGALGGGGIYTVSRLNRR